MRKIKAFSLLLIAMSLMLFAGNISETHISVNAQDTYQTKHKKKPAKKAKKPKKHTKTKHKKGTKKKATKKKKAVKKHVQKTTKAKKKHVKKAKKAIKAKKKVVKHKKAKKKAPKKAAKKVTKKKKAVKKTTKKKNVVTVVKPATTTPKSDANQYESVDGFNYPSDDYATPNATDTLNIPSGYLFSFNNATKQMDQGTASDASIQQSRQINTFHPSTADVNNKVDINNISTDLQRQLSQYAANLVNDLRHKLANNYPYTQDLTVTNRALQASSDVAKGYNNDNWNFSDKGGHDTAVLNNVFKNYQFSGYGENIAGSLLTSSYIEGPVTLANVKESIYGAICAMMFDDASSNWGHAINFLGIKFDSSARQEFGVSIDKMGQIHYEIYQ
ncbi:SEC10/PgrA surface exclusion domain-containing protein [Apilactobacillus kunkeei]|uniref:SEC10/PgrA surface exclusion domain-containing protein n=1 Tax=Apilactobacillus nanyangensis TaxID=2799579 RepID=A0ABT0HVZ0_9LACO|nr:SEC10/PgrA surface exclusion domain-containing protein [Apilactobacillus nanyangensis]MCK8611105.1 SEC10/PgrA surface exclusion domain-containing protein [Apilactobacillus nanyangensis]TMS99943.1 SEC10/PgrA surface exclusion domain-containing protein [Apilactobacillus kunkeei]TMT03293.1 SEC10/PgrA surface exclusion domain-containing protein [Apilactobacillus kunkeei]